MTFSGLDFDFVLLSISHYGTLFDRISRLHLLSRVPLMQVFLVLVLPLAVWGSVLSCPSLVPRGVAQVVTELRADDFETLLVLGDNGAQGINAGLRDDDLTQLFQQQRNLSIPFAELSAFGAGLPPPLISQFLPAFFARYRGEAMEGVARRSAFPLLVRYPALAAPNELNYAIANATFAEMLPVAQRLVASLSAAQRGSWKLVVVAAGRSDLCRGESSANSLTALSALLSFLRSALDRAVILVLPPAPLAPQRPLSRLLCLERAFDGSCTNLGDVCIVARHQLCPALLNNSDPLLLPSFLSALPPSNQTLAFRLLAPPPFPVPTLLSFFFRFSFLLLTLPSGSTVGGRLLLAVGRGAATVGCTDLE